MLVTLVKPDPRCSWEGHSWRVGAGVGDESTEYRKVDQPLRLHWWSAQCAAHMLLLSDELMRRAQMGVSIWDAVHSHSVDRWVLSGTSVEAPCTACQRKRNSFAAKLRRLDACENRKIVRWFRTQASSHNSQGAVDAVEVNEAMSTASPYTSPVGLSAVERTRARFAIRSVVTPATQQAASGVQRVMSTFCEVTRGVGDIWVTCPTLLRGIWVRIRREGFCLYHV